jgi:hypothetical protein
MTSQEIVDFMLGGGTKSTRPTATPSAKTLSPRSPPFAAQDRQRGVIIKAMIQSVLTWLDHDDTACQLVHSIANLRDRVWSTSQMLVHLQRQGDSRAPSHGSICITLEPSWKQFGYRSGGVGTHGSGTSLSESDRYLNADDLNMTLDHGLQQHERMLALLRRTMAALSTALDAMGRRLDELYRHDLAGHGSYDMALNTVDPHRSRLLSLDNWNNLFTATSNELYRKQKLTEQVLDSSVAEGLLMSSVADNDGLEPTHSNATNPRRVAHLCGTTWSRTHQESHLYNHGHLLKEIHNQSH